jgi:Tol biopolymer transport system component
VPDALRDQLQSTLGAAYSIERELGGGGMSRVFVAEEKALGRKVVVKIFPSDASGAVSIERFKREIQLAAQLQHPHIVPVLSAGETGGVPYYIMPFVRGESLRQHLTQSGERAVNEAVRILRDVAGALAHAHSEGIVHRDIKPENVMLSGGVAVVTDFGVAKAMSVAAQPSTQVPGAMLTSLGIALGTPTYMSPEQASGDPNVDHRADIYSLGCLGYELLSGSPPFAGRTPQQVLAAHVSEQPESLRKRRPTVPGPLADLIMRCLEKHAADRPQTADQVVLALDAIATPSGGTTPTDVRMRAVRRSRRTWVVGGIAVAGVLATVATIIVLNRPTAPFIADADAPIIATPELEMDAAISPTGKFVAYAAGSLGKMQIFVRQVGGGSIRQVSGNVSVNARWPRWRPDETQIAFVGNGAIYVVPSLGGSVQKFVDLGSFPAWSADGSEIAYFLADDPARTAREQSNNIGAIWAKPVQGGSPRKIATADDASALAWSPDGTRIAYMNLNSAILTGRTINVAPSAVYTVAASGGEPRLVSDRSHINTSPAWAPDSRSILYVSSLQGSRDVFQQAVGSDGAARGDPIRVTTGLNVHSITLSADGTKMAYSTLVLRANVWSAPISATGVTPFSAATPVTTDNQSIESIAVSRDGKWLYYDSNRSGNADIYKVALNAADGAPEPIQLTNDPADDFAPRPSADGNEIAFYSMRFGSRDIFVMHADGTNVERVTDFPGEEYHPSWSTDGKLVFSYSTPSGVFTTFLAARGADGTWSAPRQIFDFFAPAPTLGAAQWSPDGRHISMERLDSLWLLSPDGTDRRVLMSSSSFAAMAAWALGWQDTWNPVDNTLIVHIPFSDGGATFWAISMTGGPPRLLLRLDDPSKRTRRTEFATDGKRLYFTIASDEADVRLMTLKRQGKG